MFGGSCEGGRTTSAGLLSSRACVSVVPYPPTSRRRVGLPRRGSAFPLRARIKGDPWRLWSRRAKEVLWLLGVRFAPPLRMTRPCEALPASLPRKPGRNPSSGFPLLRAVRCIVWVQAVAVAVAGQVFAAQGVAQAAPDVGGARGGTAAAAREA